MRESFGKIVKKGLDTPVRDWGKRAVVFGAAILGFSAWSQADGDPQKTGDIIGRNVSEFTVDHAETGASVVGNGVLGVIGLVEGSFNGATGRDINFSLPRNQNSQTSEANSGLVLVASGEGWIAYLNRAYGISYKDALECTKDHNLNKAPIHPDTSPANPC